MAVNINTESQSYRKSLVELWRVQSPVKFNNQASTNYLKLYIETVIIESEA